MSSIRNIKPIKRTRAWLSGEQQLSYKVSYFFNVLVSYLRLAVIRRRYVNYLGNRFDYDATVTPLGLMLYPEEVGQIIENVSNVKSILDIGGNIGQFAVSMNALLPTASIDSLEPNPASYDLLVSNTDYTNKIKTFQLGVGKPGQMTLYYNPNRTVNASLLEKNATYRTKSSNHKGVKVDIINDIQKVTKRKKYDLIKIDVEGYEYETLKNITNISTKYLYMEITGQGREKNYLHSDLLAIIKNKFGSFDILYTTRASKFKFEVLFAFK